MYKFVLCLLKNCIIVTLLKNKYPALSLNEVLSHYIDIDNIDLMIRA